jgi:hypothetical protein
MTSPNEPLYEAINAWIQASCKDALYTLSAPMKATTMQLDGSYKVKPLVGNEEFFLRRVRGGKRDEFIFEFEPAADAPYKHVEMNNRIANETFPGFGAQIATGIGYPDLSLEKAAKAFMKELKEKAEAEVEAHNKGTYEDNAQWGMF